MTEINVSNNSNNENVSNKYNSSFGLLTQIIQNFNKIEIKEIKPTIQNINESIYEEDLSIVVDELNNLTLNELNKGCSAKERKNHIITYINNHKIILQEIYNWLLNNQYHSIPFFCLDILIIMELQPIKVSIKHMNYIKRQQI
ncbi:uncharacterized protein OCT59_023559 [Rhizophagus irregularis]|uniref:uncharacterized protein n=1 Tax=Rhizophagus irregularis TaxID=588596 RepID=UPI001A08327B|nr:hypothetical protein OCT59_023559 [Rhizophagus irregularis]GET58294.1 kinase-like domain-containing protein [Rhizophagus irregularis DAOM 181602=DAOM 197198]